MTSTSLEDKLISGHMRAGRGTAGAADFGDIRAEFNALLCGCGVSHLDGRAKITLTGSDRVRWLNGMVSNNVRDLVASHGLYAFLLNPQGHILADLYAYNRGDSLLVDTDHSQLERVLSIFDKYIIMDRVEVANVSEKLTAIGIAGPKVRDVLRDAGFDVAELEPLQFVDLTWQQIGLSLVRGDHPSVQAFEFWLAPSNVASLWEALGKAGAKPVGTGALDLLRIAAGIPRYGQDIRERDLPQETEQQRALHFAKGCYIGQEIVERIRSRGHVRRKFTGFEIDGPLPACGAQIQADGKDSGEITSAASLPGASGEHRVALGYIRREIATPGKEVMIGETKARVAALPFSRM
jgi:folate-binding protein YgfZ